MTNIRINIDLKSLSNGDIKQLLKDVDAEAKARGMGLDSPLPELSIAEKALTETGRKITAIKEYRARTGLGLKDSKDAVDLYYYNWARGGCAVGGLGES